MKIKIYAPEIGIIIKRFNVYSHKELMRKTYGDELKDLKYMHEGLEGHFKEI